MAKEHSGRELWERMQEFVAQDDGLPCYDCGSWTLHKLFFLCQYLATTTQAIVGNPKFSSVNYVDMFAGNGVCRLRDEEGRRPRYAGSAMLAAGCRKPFDNVFVVEREAENVQALQERLRRLGAQSKIKVFQGDANAEVTAVASAIPDRSLTVAFVDPFSLDVHFASVAALASARPLDLIILFADAMDIARNVEEYYYPKRSDKLDLFLGSQSNWRAGWDRLTDRSGYSCRRFFGNCYLSQLTRLGYRHTRIRPIQSDLGQPLYSLVYASKHPLGLKFWDIASHEDLGGNRGLWPGAV